jgi:hypothetical protein
MAKSVKNVETPEGGRYRKAGVDGQWGGYLYTSSRWNAPRSVLTGLLTLGGRRSPNNQQHIQKTPQKVGVLKKKDNGFKTGKSLFMLSS